MNERRERQLFQCDSERPREEYKKIVLALLEQCKDADLTVRQAGFVLDSAASLLRQCAADEKISRLQYDA